MVFAGNRAGDGGLLGASPPVQPEDASFITLISPCHYLLEHVDSGVAEAKRVVSLVVRVEGCLGSERQQSK